MTMYLLRILYKWVCHYYVFYMSLAGNRVISSFPGKHCWVRLGVYNYIWVPISSQKVFFYGSPNNINSCACRAQLAGNQTSHPELSSQWRPALLDLSLAMWKGLYYHSHHYLLALWADPWVSANKYVPCNVFTSARLPGLKQISEWRLPNQVWVSIHHSAVNNAVLLYCGQACVNYCGHVLIGV